MPSRKYTIASSVYYKRLILTCLLAKIKIKKKKKNETEYNIWANVLLQIKINRSYSAFLNDIAQTKLRICASFVLFCFVLFCFPLPVYPRLKVQWYKPIELLHCAFI